MARKRPDNTILDEKKCFTEEKLLENAKKGITFKFLTTHLPFFNSFQNPDIKNFMINNFDELLANFERTGDIEYGTKIYKRAKSLILLNSEDNEKFQSFLILIEYVRDITQEKEKILESDYKEILHYYTERADEKIKEKEQSGEQEREELKRDAKQFTIKALDNLKEGYSILYTNLDHLYKYLEKYCEEDGKTQGFQNATKAVKKLGSPPKVLGVEIGHIKE